MKIFIICPVRNAGEEQKEQIVAYIDKLTQSGNSVYYPAIHTDQSGNGVNICTQNRTAIANADEIHIFYDPNSAGSLFDLGMAYAFGKKLVLINDVEPTIQKSFANVILKWARVDKERKK